MHESRKRNIIIASLCGVLLLMAIGYAAFQSILNIEGTANITSNWDIKITNIEEKDKVGSAESAEEPTHEDLTATFSVNLVSPGDSISYDVTVENQGNLDAELEKITMSESPNPAIKFETSGIEEGSELNSGDSAILKLTITYDENVTSQPENTEANILVTLDYIDKNSRSIPAIYNEGYYYCPDTYDQSGSGDNITCSKQVTETTDYTVDNCQAVGNEICGSESAVSLCCCFSSKLTYGQFFKLIKMKEDIIFPLICINDPFLILL